jgi:hypothetical protein
MNHRERRLAVKRQLATFRAIADELDHCMARHAEEHDTRGGVAQLCEEMARLGSRALEAAAAAARDEAGGVQRLPVGENGPLAACRSGREP